MLDKGPPVDTGHVQQRHVVDHPRDRPGQGNWALDTPFVPRHPFQQVHICLQDGRTTVIL